MTRRIEKDIDMDVLRQYWWRLVGLTVSILLAGAIANGASPGPAWTAINDGIAGASLGITRLTVDPTTPSTLYAVTNNGRIF